MTTPPNHNKDTQHENPITRLPQNEGNTPAFAIDVDYYQQVIDDPNVSEARKRELIEIIGNIVMSFIDLGFGIHPVQLAQNEKHRPQQREKEQRLERQDL
ncbi:MAG: hypothetical protein ACSHYC_00185 [Alphaproteobacteria bacterium]